jgi:acetoin utilization protein AcuB
MRVQDAMTGTVFTLSPGDTLRDAIDALRSHRVRHLPVIEEGRLVGMVTDRDVKRATPSVLSGITEEAYDAALLDINVHQFMTRQPSTVTSTTGLKAAVADLIETRVGALPVVDEGRLVGILTEFDVLRIAHDLLKD